MLYEVITVPEVILVPGPGVARWTAMALARRFGAWMNGRFPLPRITSYNVRYTKLLRPGEGGARVGASVGFGEDGGGVELEIRGPDRATELIRARYLIGCDGAIWIAMGST